MDLIGLPTHRLHPATQTTVTFRMMGVAVSDYNGRAGASCGRRRPSC